MDSIQKNINSSTTGAQSQIASIVCPDEKRTTRIQRSFALPGVDSSRQPVIRPPRFSGEVEYHRANEAVRLARVEHLKMQIKLSQQVLLIMISGIGGRAAEKTPFYRMVDGLDIDPEPYPNFDVDESLLGYKQKFYMRQAREDPKPRNILKMFKNFTYENFAIKLLSSSLFLKGAFNEKGMDKENSLTGETEDDVDELKMGKSQPEDSGNLFDEKEKKEGFEAVGVEVKGDKIGGGRSEKEGNRLDRDMYRTRIDISE